MDAAALASLALVGLTVVRLVRMGVKAVWAEYQAANPPYAAGCMAVMAIANWAHTRGFRFIGSAAWAAALTTMLFGQLLFLRILWSKWSTPGVGPDAPPRSAQKLWKMAAVVWILPLVGVSAASGTGGNIVSTAISDYALHQIALFGPVALGGFWASVLIFPLYAKVTSHALWTDATSAILMAPAALNLVGYLGAVGVDVAARNSWLVHLLGWMVIAFGLRPIAAVPAIIDLRKPFSPAIASAGFPMEIVAIALVRYQAVLQQVSCRRGVCYVYIRTGSVQIDRRPTRPRARSLTLRRLDPELRRSSKDWPGYNLCSLRLLSRSSSHALRLRLSEPSKPLVRPATS